MQELRNKTIVITGASRGIGAGLANYFAGMGANLALCSRSQPSREDLNCPVVTQKIDVANETQVAEFARQVATKFKKIDLWINNAGILEPIKPLRKVTSAEFTDHIRVNLIGVFNGSKSYVNHLREVGGGGVLVNISSGAARSPYSGWGCYCSGKAAVEMLTRCVALEENSIGLKAYSLSPGIVDTNMQEMIRGTDAGDFPMVEKFHQVKAQNAFKTTDQVAQKVIDLAFSCDEDGDEVVVQV